MPMKDPSNRLTTAELTPDEHAALRAHCARSRTSTRDLVRRLIVAHLVEAGELPDSSQPAKDGGAR